MVGKGHDCVMWLSQGTCVVKSQKVRTAKTLSAWPWDPLLWILLYAQTAERGEMVVFIATYVIGLFRNTFLPAYQDIHTSNVY